MKWLHLSDIHFNFVNYSSQKVREQLKEKIKSLRINADFILITGDCLYKNNDNQNDLKNIVSYIQSIARACNCSCNHIYLCAGNHDVSRNDIIRNNLICEIRDKKIEFSNKYDKLSKLGIEKFQIIHKKITNYEYESYKVISPKRASYRIISLNSSLLSMDKADYQKLKICNDKLSEISSKIPDDNRINILILHHGIECLEAEDAKKFEHWVEDNHIDIVYCGHTHRAAVETYNNIFREVKQFTTGAIIVDNYAIPSFYLCESNDDLKIITLQLYTYSPDTENWNIDNSHLRKFKNGIYTYNLSRKTNPQNTEIVNIDLFKTIINEFNEKYKCHYGNSKIYSEKVDDYEKFDSWKIIQSLVEVDVSYERALFMTNTIINKITDTDFRSKDSFLSCLELRDIVYETIIHYKPQNNENEFDVSCWASRYARKYNRNIEIMVINKSGDREKLNYGYVKDTLIKRVLDSITGNSIIYDKIIQNELLRMANVILNFLKNMGIFEIREEALQELVKEKITQIPHPWVVNKNRSELIDYHKKQGATHIEDLQNGKSIVISQTEAAYHICAAFLVQYDDYIGCTEISPIIILFFAVNYSSQGSRNGHPLPMEKYKLIQLKKDLEKQSINYEEFTACIRVLHNNIVNSQNVTKEETRNSLLCLWGMLKKLEQKVMDNKITSPVEKVRNIFDSGCGFLVKANLRNLPNCFWIDPNWELYERTPQHLGKQILVCVIEVIDDIEKIYEYLYGQDKQDNLTEIVFVYSSFSSFSSDDRKLIRKKFNGKYLRCIFIQENDFKKIISDECNWRRIFFEIICISRIS